MSMEKVALEHGLSIDEYKLIVEKLGREPDHTELGVFSALWSEHCSYKSSRKHLSKFLTTGDHVVQGPGENAGIVDIGDGQCITFKMESHNHPSYIEPFQGAATGVGGILRDVFTMGARPIAILDLLRFGKPVSGRNRYIMNGVVSGIAHYGNCMGVPTVGGDTFFHSSFNGNPLLNAMCVGLVKKEKIFKGYASGVGNPVLYVGSKTGRDGIHGASMSSDVFESGEELQRSAVQVGDPFTEKLLLEACLELMKMDVIVGIQDMGAAGISSSSFEMADRSGTGVLINFDKVPVRAANLSPYELMLSESQERMLLVVEKGKENVAGEVFEKWGLDWAVIGEVIEEPYVKGTVHNELVLNMSVDLLTSNAPKYDRPYSENLDRVKRKAINPEAKISDIKDGKKIKGKLIYLLGSANICSKHDIFENYDHMVRTSTVVHPGWDGALIRIKGTTKGVGLSAAAKSRYCKIDPYLGGAYSALDAVMNVVIMGTKPLAITDCLNFGNPQNPHVMFDLVKTIEGIDKICRSINMPVVSGNVSLYNETDGEPILPTPSIGCVSLMQDINCHITPYLKKAGNELFLVSLCETSLTGSEYVSEFYSDYEYNGELPELDFNKLSGMVDFFVEGAKEGYICSSHDIGLGGLLTELAKMICFSKNKNPNLGIKLDSNFVGTSSRLDTLFFGEAPCMAILETNDSSKLINEAKSKNITIQKIGTVIEESLLNFSVSSISAQDIFMSYYGIKEVK